MSTRRLLTPPAKPARPHAKARGGGAVEVAPALSDAAEQPSRSPSDWEVARAAVQQSLGHVFSAPDLLDAALTHASWAAEAGKGARTYERLEFVGDTVLSLAVARSLYETFPDAEEGVMSRMRARIVCEPGLAAVARQHGWGPAIRLGIGEERSGGADKPSILADVVEALLGAVFLDAGFEASREIVLRLFAEPLALAIADELPGSGSDHKTALQRTCQGRVRLTPYYLTLSQSGRDHELTFECAAMLGDRELGRGGGRSKKAAEQAAAAAALRAITSQPSLLASDRKRAGPGA